jgi:hypothetical protein
MISGKKSWRVNAKVVEKNIDRRQARLLGGKTPPWSGTQDNRQTSNWIVDKKMIKSGSTHNLPQTVTPLSVRQPGP